MRPTSPAAVAAAAALALAGCGGDGDSDKQKIEATLNAYYTGFADRDGKKACDQLSRAAQRQVVKATDTSDCPTAIERATKRRDIAPYTERFRDAKVVSVTVAGSRATAKVTALGEESTVTLVKEGGKWKIQGGPGAPGG